MQVRPMVLAEPVLSERLAAQAFEIQTGGVHEHQVEPAEQIAPMREQMLLDQVLPAAWREPRRPILLIGRQCLAEPGHGTIEMVQLEVIAAGDAILLAPAIGRQI